MRKALIDCMLFSCIAVMVRWTWGSGVRKAVIDCMLFSCRWAWVSCDGLGGRWAWGSGVRKAVIDYMLFSCSAVIAGGLGEVV